jgi:hypothetical protein
MILHRLFFFFSLPMIALIVTGDLALAQTRLYSEKCYGQCMKTGGACLKCTLRQRSLECATEPEAECQMYLARCVQTCEQNQKSPFSVGINETKRHRN